MYTKQCLVLLALCFTANAAQAQGARIGVYRGISEYDLSGVDQATINAVRVSYDIGPILSVETGLVAADLQLQFGAARLYLPDVHLQARLPLGPVAPYLGAGAGLSVEDPDEAQFATNTRATFSAAAGVRVDLPYRLALGAEGRIRTFGTGFTASGAEAVVGLAYRFR
jgi:hypothetical protein